MTKKQNFQSKNSHDDAEMVKELMQDPAVIERCQDLDKKGVQYEVIPIRTNRSTN